MVMIELCYCKITGRTRALPKVHHFIPLAPWTCNKIKGKRKVMNIDSTNDGPSSKFERKEQIKLVLDMSNDGPTFRMLESMLSGGKGGENGAFSALAKLMQSGIPGLEGFLTPGGMGKMSDEDKKRFIEAVTGAGGKIDSRAAAALIAAAASGGDPEIANKIIEKMMSGLGDEIDPAMMSALMATTALVAAGASNEEILAAMQRELAASGLSPEEILAKTLLLQRCLAGDNSPAFINKTLKNALNVANITPEELARALYVEKAMAASGASPEDIAKTLLIQTALRAKGVPPDVIAAALNRILKDSSDQTGILAAVEAALQNNDLSLDEVNKVLAMSKALDGGKVRGMKDLQKLLDDCSVDSIEGIEALLRQVFDSGVLSPAAVEQAMIFQKAIASSGVGADTVARAILLQKCMAESGMAIHEIANAMSLVMTIDPKEEKVKELKDALKACVGRGLTPQDIELLLAFKEALESGEIPKEAINLMKKAMKQRRGSVDNVAEALMESLAASGQSQEAIARAMVKALQATGATPQEIAKTMQSSMSKSGASQEEICKVMAAAMAASGASAEEIAIALKETFAKAMADNPTAAADIARAMAVALASAGASAEDIARTMQEALAASVGAGGATSPEDLLEIAQTVARVMAEAGASPEEIRKAMQDAIKSAGKIDDPELMAELTKTMARAMADAGASGEDIARAMHDALAASGASEEEIAQSMLAAMASSGASADIIAKTMQAAMAQSGLSPEECQKRVIQAMVESGATAEEIAHTMVQQNLMNAIGGSPEDMAKQLLSELRSGRDITVQSIERILQRAGIHPETASKVLLFQKALAACGTDPEDVAKAILLQKAWLNGYGNTPENIAKVLEDIMAKEAGGEELQNNLVEMILKKLSSEDMSCDDVLKAIMFNNAFDTNGASVNIIKDLVNKSHKSPTFDCQDLGKAMQDLLCGNGATTDAILRTAMLQKLLTALGISPDDLAKVFGLQKCMYDAGASPQDVAMMMEMVLGGGHVKLGDMDELLRKHLSRKLNPTDVVNIVEVVDAFNGTKIPPELIAKIMLMQKAIESDISSPEMSSQDLANKLKRPNCSPETFTQDLHELLKKNGLSVESLEKTVLIQKLTAACALQPRELAVILDLQTRMLEAGRSPEEIAMAFKELIAKSGVEVKGIAQALLAVLEQGRIKGEEIACGSFIFDAVMHPTGLDGPQSEISAMIMREMRGNPSQNDIINLVRKALEMSKVRLDALVKVVLLQKLLAATESQPSDLAKVVRIENAILRAGVTAENLCKTINEAIKPRNKAILEKLKRPLDDALTSGMVGVSAAEIQFCQDFQKAIKSNVQADESKLKEVFDNAMKVSGLSKEDMAKALMVQKTLAASGVTPEIMVQAIQFQKALMAAGISPAEIADIFNKAVKDQMGEKELSDLVASIMTRKGCSKEDIEKMLQLQRSLTGGVLASGDKLGTGLTDMFASGLVDAALLQKAMVMQKVLAACGLSPEDLGKAFLLQNAMIEAGASPENVANCMHRTLMESGISLEHMITLMEIELKASLAKGLTASDIVRVLQFDKILGASSFARRVMRRINPEALRLMEATVRKQVPGQKSSIMEAMKSALGGVIDQATLQAMEVSEAMAAAGASKEEIEEMMQMIINKGGGISEEFLTSIKEAMAEGGGNPMAKLAALKIAMEEEMSSVSNALRNTFINRIPTTEEIASTCRQLAEKLGADAAARTDVKLALVDVLDEALQDVMEYVPDADMIFNYLMISALAAATDYIEREGLRPTGDDLQELARLEMLEMIERLLLEADLEDQLPKLEVYGKTIDGIKELLRFLLQDPSTGRALKRQVAFLFDFEEIEHTTVLGLTLQDILKDAKHKLRPWELEKKRKIRGLKRALVPNLGYSQIYCYYRVLPEHLEGPPIGLSYE